MSSRRPPPAFCANCGTALPRDARACPDCGADERTGWREAPVDDGLDLPDAADDPGPPAPTFARPPGWRHPLPWYWIAAALLALAVLALGALRLW